MGVVKNSASISVTSGKATVGYHLSTPKHVYGHLTNGFTVQKDTAFLTHAWDATGTLKLDSGTTNGADFGFIQFQRIKATGFDYVGATPADGSIRLTVSEPSAMSQKLALDSRDACTPWTRAPGINGRFQFNVPNVTTDTGDHPAVKILKQLANDTTKKVNLLRSLTDKREFWTLLATTDDNGKATYFQHFHWTVSYVATFKWVGGAIVLDSSSGSNVTFDSVKNGLPSDSTLAALLAKPAGPMANTLMDNALTASLANGQGHNRTDFSDGTCGGDITVPSDFSI